MISNNRTHKATTEKTTLSYRIIIRENINKMQTLNYIDKLEKAESMVFNKIPKGKKENYAREFKKLISNMGLSVEFFLLSYKDKHSSNKTQYQNIRKKILNFIDIADIKTNLGFYYGDSISKNKVFTMLN